VTTEADLISAELVRIAPSLGSGPLAGAAQEALVATRALGDSPWACQARAWTVAYLFGGMERAFADQRDPTEAIFGLLGNVAEFCRAASASGYAQIGSGGEADTSSPSASSAEVAEVTGEHYGRLFAAFSASSYLYEPTRLLRTRLERNGIDPEIAVGKEVLDSGCGGGRYSVAWRQLGARRVTGLDISATGIDDATRRVSEAKIEGVVFRQGSVLELPFGDQSFDIVFSNGVLHHTTDWTAGVNELVRVLRPGGFGWLYLIENPGGLFWDVIEVLRAITQGESRERARRALYALGLPPNRVFYMLDHVMVPINLRLTPSEVEGALANAGAVQVHRLTRGADFDRVERIHANEAFAVTKYGVGENRYVFSKT
jgi:SAM-dependent methyltransferase